MAKDSNRLCYWCIESQCLDKRVDHEKKNKGVIYTKGANYAEFREKLDKATSTMCKKYKTVKARSDTGAEVFQVERISHKKDIEEEVGEILQVNVFTAHNETSNTSEEEEERSPNKLHCHKSCSNYIRRCETPDGCKQKRLNKEGCPITKQVGYHSCGMIKTISKKTTS